MEAETYSGIKEFQNIIVIVCGYEDIKLTQSAALVPYWLYEYHLTVLEYPVADYTTYFMEDKYCPVTSY